MFVAIEVAPIISFHNHVEKFVVGSLLKVEDFCCKWTVIEHGLAFMYALIIHFKIVHRKTVLWRVEFMYTCRVLACDFFWNCVPNLSPLERCGEKKLESKSCFVL